MIARAPGKLVLSGAYSVLEGAPALVAAVDRYAVADAARSPELVPDEVRAAMDLGLLDQPAWFDVSALRAPSRDGTSRKLGLGSSAAILVASMAARAALLLRERGEGPPWIDPRALFEGALAAHRRAQGGGSGVDVAASVHGGVLCCQLPRGASAGPLTPLPSAALSVAPHALPDGLAIAVFSSAVATQTSSMLGRVRALTAAAPAAYCRLLDNAAEGARAAAAARGAAAFVEALDQQVDALAELGDLAGAPIVTRELHQLRPKAASEGAAFAPSGAGGGDVAMFVGLAPPSSAFLAAACSAGLELVPMSLGARGVHALAPG